MAKERAASFTSTTYGDKLKDPRWQKVRLKIMERDEFTCRLCLSITDTLNVHHITYTAASPWDETWDNLITICEHCHQIVNHCKSKRQINSFRAITSACLMMQLNTSLIASGMPDQSGSHERMEAQPKDSEDLFG